MRIRKSAESRKSEIIDAALLLADELGPDRLTTEGIANAVGLTQAGVFRHFPKKQELWEAVAARIGEMMEAHWAKARSHDSNPSDRIALLVAGQLALIQSMPAIPAILFSRELNGRNEGLRKTFLGLMGRFHGVVAGMTTEAIEAGELRDDLDPGDVAFLIIGLVQGLAVRWSISGRKFDLVKEGKRLLALQLSGLARAPSPADVEMVGS
ncbi:MAG: TetR/AcrR family transcriptional regulator [Alphaproteobacteria bacterium]